MVRTEGTSAGAGFYTMSKKQSSKVRAQAEKQQQPALTVERITEISERHTLDGLFGDDAVRLAFHANDGGPYIGYLASGHLARYDANGVHVVALGSSVETLSALYEHEDGWSGGDALARWLKDVAAALPRS